MKNNDKELVSIWNSAMISANILRNFLIDDVKVSTHPIIKELDSITIQINSLYEKSIKSSKYKKLKKKYKKLCKKYKKLNRGTL